MAKVIIFDMDGVIFDTIPFAQKEFLETHPSLTEDMYKEIHSGNFHEEAQKHAHLRIEETEEQREIRRANYSEVKSKSVLFPGIKDFLQHLHNSGFNLILNTNAYERNTLPLLENVDIRALFDFVATAELSKSKIEKFLLIKNKFGLNTEDILFITDSLGDLREADSANIATVAVTWGVHDEAYFKRERHDNLKGVVHSVSELKDFIDTYKN